MLSGVQHRLFKCSHLTVYVLPHSLHWSPSVARCTQWGVRQSGCSQTVYLSKQCMYCHIHCTGHSLLPGVLSGAWHELAVSLFTTLTLFATLDSLFTPLTDFATLDTVLPCSLSCCQVYSVVRDRVRLELVQQLANGAEASINDQLIKLKLADKAEETYLSKVGCRWYSWQVFIPSALLL